jgi:5'-3' exonuclease
MAEVPSSIALVDLSYMFRRDWHGNERGETNRGPMILMERLESLRTLVQHVILCQDAPPYRRKEFYPEYKGTRQPISDEMKSALRWVKERIEQDGFQVARADGYEADDLIATLAREYEAAGCKDIQLVGCDKDLFQLVRGPVRVFIPGVGEREAEILDGGGVHAKLDVAPVQVVDYLCMVGDDGDNIKGAPGVGPKRAASVLRDWGTLEFALQAVERGEEVVSPLVTKALQEHGKRLLEVNRRLIKLDEFAPVDAFVLLHRLQPIRRAVSASAPDVDDDDDENESELVDPNEMISAPPVMNVPTGGYSSQVHPRAEEVSGQTWGKAPAAMARKVAEQPHVSALLAARPAEPSLGLKKASNDNFGIVSDKLQPRDLRSARCLAHWFAGNRRFDKFGGVDAVFTIIMRAVELQIDVTALLDSIHLVADRDSGGVKLVYPAVLIQHLVMRDPDCEYLDLVETTAEKATYEIKRRSRPKPVTLSYTLAEAKEAELYRPTYSGKKSTWQKQTADMLRKTCAVKLCRAVFPGATLGLYCFEELTADVRDDDEREAA